MIPFVIEHQLKADLPQTGSLSSLPEIEVPPALVFETCMRRMRIRPWGEAVHAPPYGQLMAGPEAYSFLLEILSGLRSPVFGETEIFSQFKIFWENAQKSSARHQFFAPWARRLIEDTKKIRSEFFRDGTTQTWGGVVRKSLRAFPEVWIVGNGQLALSVAAALKSQKLVFWARQEKEGLPGAHHRWGERPCAGETPRAVVICAPLENSEVLALADLKPQHFQWVADLREAQDWTADFIDFHLNDIETASELNQKRALEIQIQAQDRIANLTAETWDLLWHRPLGWEDLCG